MTLAWPGPYVACTEPRWAMIGTRRAMETMAPEQEAATLERILFPPRAPAGWDPLKEPSVTMGDLVRWRADVNDKLRRCASDLFEASIGDGLLPSEAADVVVQSPDYIEHSEQYLWLCEKTGFRRPDRLDARRYFRREFWAMSQDLGRALERGIAAENAMMPAIRRIAPLPSALRCSTSSAERQANRLWFLADPLLPGVVVRGMLASHLAYAMSAALHGFIYRPRHNFHMIKAAASIWAQEAHRYLVLVASVPGSGIPAEVVPLDQRFDLSRESSEQTSLIAALTDTAA